MEFLTGTGGSTSGISRSARHRRRPSLRRPLGRGDRPVSGRPRAVSGPRSSWQRGGGASRAPRSPPSRVSRVSWPGGPWPTWSGWDMCGGLDEGEGRGTSWCECADERNPLSLLSVASRGGARAIRKVSPTMWRLGLIGCRTAGRAQVDDADRAGSRGHRGNRDVVPAALGHPGFWLGEDDVGDGSRYFAASSPDGPWFRVIVRVGARGNDEHPLIFATPSPMTSTNGDLQPSGMCQPLRPVHMVRSFSSSMMR